VRSTNDHEKNHWCANVQTHAKGANNYNWCPSFGSDHDGQEWVTALPDELQEIFVSAILKNWFTPANQDLK